eukprot:CAMPEP_0113442038 /NCGR_PEP_ID=MMETSP0014_2-20120614/1403_1 /TAXON_ID=2857 /ORGANISM="Nitzschia sp." /LENGTH=288 /DNA_ID=CAMNT_0000332923 /DNA_START=46 /DNA_END=912 /DNA_ORIENTATION=+ /assembly_acc=CAM_ASM_000159
MMSRRQSTTTTTTTTVVFVALTTLLLIANQGGVAGDDDANPFCLICPDGNEPTNGNGLVGSRSCAEVYQQGLDKELTSSECTYVQILLAQPQDTCGCGGSGTTTSSPAGTPGTTPVPTVAPTPIPPTTATPTVDQREICNVCGFDEPQLSDPGAFIDPTIGLSCGQYQDFAISPGLTPTECNAARLIAIPICGCRAASFLPTPAPAPTAPVVTPTVSPAPTDAPPDPTIFCTVCTNGNESFSNKAIGGEICGALDYDGRRFKYTQSECLTIQAAAATAPGDPCDCLDP